MGNGLNCWHVFILLELLHNCLNLGFLFFFQKKKALVEKNGVCNFKWSLKMKQFIALYRKAYISSELFYLPSIIFLFFKTPFHSPFQYFYTLLEMHSFSHL